MKNMLFFMFALFLYNNIDAQPGYQYNGATGKYEYNTDPLGQMGQRYENFTQMQIGTLQRLNSNLQQTYSTPMPNSGGDIKTAIDATVMLGKRRISEGEASNFFQWKHNGTFNQYEISQAELIKTAITKNSLRTNHYADVKAFVIISLYLTAKGINEDNVTLKKAEAKKIDMEYLKNEYIQGMDDEQRTENIMYDFRTLEKINKLGKNSAEAKNIAVDALQSKGYKKADQLTITANGLEDIGKVAIQNKQAKTTFTRTNHTFFIDRIKETGKATDKNIEKSAYYLQSFDALIQKLNGPNNDHVFAQSIIFGIYYVIYTEGKSLTPTQQESVFKLFYNDLINDAGFQASTDKELQLFYEANAIECMAISDIYTNALQQKIEFEKKMNDPRIDPNEKYALSVSTKVYDNLNNAKYQAHEMLKKYFQPRNFDDYILNERGFVKK